MRQLFAPRELQNIEIQEPFPFTKGCQLMKIEAGSGFVNPFQYGSKLFNLETNPKQEEEIEDLEIELTFIHKIAEQMRKNDAPKEQFIRLGIPEDGIMTIEDLKRQKEIIQKAEKIAILEEHQWDRAAQNQIRALLNIFPENERQHLLNMFKDFVVESKTPKINTNLVDHFIDLAIPKDRKAQATYFLKLASRTN